MERPQLDPTRIQIADIADSQAAGLARKLRKELPSQWYFHGVTWSNSDERALECLGGRRRRERRPLGTISTCPLPSAV